MSTPSTTSNTFDLIFLGSGPGGYVGALEAARLGARVAVVESAQLGGTCLNNGCIPSKALLATAELMHHAAHAKSLGVNIEGTISVDWAAVQKRKDSVLRRLRNGVKSLFEKRGIALVEGWGRFDGPGRIAVTSGTGVSPVSSSSRHERDAHATSRHGQDAHATRLLTAPKIVLAVGSVPSSIPGWPSDSERVSTSDDALHWKTLPASLLVVGGGVIGCEFACMMQALGVEVTVVEMMDRLLPEMDRQLGEGIRPIFEKRGIRIHAATKVEDLTVSDEGCRAVLTGGAEVQADRVLVAVGRRANTSDVGLESVGLTTDRGFVRANDFMESAVGGIYSIGDVNGRCLLAHAASAQGVAAARNALSETKRPFEAPIPGAVYTFPEIASVGMTEEKVRENGIPFSIGMFPIGALGKAMAVGETDGFVKVLRHRETDAILGVHMMGRNATECIAAAGALLHVKASVEEMAEVVMAHPSVSESLKEAAEDALGAALHLPPRKVVRISVGE
ncbi:dihydrolipoyl dehydrogenase [Candidatus Sumerlaeota bacterium]|nr:dihydrolipoyl dehydrogenase [Candidatus Sumerlaeota bacterium]